MFIIFTWAYNIRVFYKNILIYIFFGYYSVILKDILVSTCGIDIYYNKKINRSFVNVSVNGRTNYAMYLHLIGWFV